jgi:hypothetical protein
VKKEPKGSKDDRDDWRRRQLKSRGQYRTLLDLTLPVWTKEATRDLLGDDVPDDIKQKLYKQVARLRQEIKKRATQRIRSQKRRDK